MKIPTINEFELVLTQQFRLGRVRPERNVEAIGGTLSLRKLFPARMTPENVFPGGEIINAPGRQRGKGFGSQDRAAGEP